MNRTATFVLSRAASCAKLGVAIFFASVTIGSLQASLWAPLPGVNPGPSNHIPGPEYVPGKDFSDYRDRDSLGGADPEQVIAWDGLGGTRDSFDYDGASILHPPGFRPLLPQSQEVDGLAAGGDALFHDLRANKAALVFSVGGIGYGAGPGDSFIHYVKPTGMPGWLPGTGVWAVPPVDIDDMNPIADLDGLELWGGNDADDSDRYSVYGDPFVPVPGGFKKVAIWSFNFVTGISDPHTFTTDLAAAMDKQYGFSPAGDGALWAQLVELMDVDAIMTFGPQVTFSIAPLDLSAQLGIIFDGGEIFEYTPGAATKFLEQGGHTYNTVLDVRGTFGVPNENIDAIEAVSQFVPEPSSVALALVALVALVKVARRKS